MCFFLFEHFDDAFCVCTNVTLFIHYHFILRFKFLSMKRFLFKKARCCATKCTGNFRWIIIFARDPLEFHKMYNFFYLPWQFSIVNVFVVSILLILWTFITTFTLLCHCCCHAFFSIATLRKSDSLPSFTFANNNHSVSFCTKL